MWIFRKTVLGPSSVACRQDRVRATTASSGPPIATLNGQRTPLQIRHLVAVLAAFCLLPSAFCLSSSPGLYEVVEIKPHVFVWVPEDILYQTGDPQFSRAATAGFIITSEGVVVVNTTNNPLNARDLLYEIRERTSQPVKYVINTDWRGNHMLGNEVFADLQATIISTSVAQVKMREYQRDLERRMEGDPRLQARMRGIHFALPNQTFDAEMTLRLGSEEIRLLDLGGGALAGGAAVYLPNAKVLFLGSFFVRGYIPRRGFSDVRAWLDILQRVEAMEAEIFVPDEGPPGAKDDLKEFHDFLDWVANEMEQSGIPENQKDPREAAGIVKAK